MHQHRVAAVVAAGEQLHDAAPGGPRQQPVEPRGEAGQVEL